MMQRGRSTSLFKIPRQSAPEDAEEPEPQPEERTMTVLQLTEGLRLTEANIRL
jgi:hypothetical protein